MEEIECRIEERCYNIVCEPEAAKKNPQTDYMMRFSLPYVVSVALSKGKVSPWEIDMRLARDSRIGGLMNRVRCVADDGKRNPGYFPGWLKIRLRTEENSSLTSGGRRERPRIQWIWTQ